jgi:hypothetical protein
MAKNHGPSSVSGSLLVERRQAWRAASWTASSASKESASIPVARRSAGRINGRSSASNTAAEHPAEPSATGAGNAPASSGHNFMPLIRAE